MVGSGPYVRRCSPPLSGNGLAAGDELQPLCVVQPLAVDGATAARMVGVSHRTWQRLHAEGVTPGPIKLGSCNKPLWSVLALQRWAEARFPDAATLEVGR